jgi:hypothetical protein
MDGDAAKACAGGVDVGESDHGVLPL